MSKTIRVYLEVGQKKTFASAIDWPGWSRGGRYEDEALAALAGYGDRYGRVVAKLTLRPASKAPGDASALEVVERLKGGASTDFGVPSEPAKTDIEPMTDADLERQSAILRACWSAFDAAAKAAAGIELRTGPRGGGRDLEKMIGHVVESEASYLGQLGTRWRDDSGADAVRAWQDLRKLVIRALAARVHGEPLPDPRAKKRPWSPRYFVRRACWHVLDHAWEIEDRVEA